MLIFRLKVCTKLFFFRLLLLLTKGFLSLFVAIPKLRGSVVVIKDARDLQNLIFPASIVRVTRKTQMQYNVLKKTWYYPRCCYSI